MTDSTHGLKDLFGSVPDPDAEPRAPKALGDQAPSGQAPAAPRPAGPAPGQVDPVPAAPASPGVPVLDAPNLAPLPEGLVARAPAAPVAPTPSSAAALSCVVVARGGVTAARRTLQALRLQTIASALDVVLVADEAASLNAEGFAGLQALVEPGTAGYGGMAAAGVRAARGELVAILDDYAFPARDWAEAVAAHRHDRFAALGSALGNANPRSAQSWSNMLLEHGPWRDGRAGGEVGRLPTRNLVFRRDALLGLGDALPAALEGGDAPTLLAAGGDPLKVAEGARIDVLNPSTRKAAMRARFAAGRLDAASHAGGMGLPKRLGKALTASLGGPARYAREKPRLFQGPDPKVNPKLQGRAVMAAMTAEGLGRAAGYLRGPGRAVQTRERMHAKRASTLNKVDRKQFGG